MAESGLFRTVFWGGYHKWEVQDYIKKLERELDDAKFESQKENNELRHQLRKAKEELAEFQKEMEEEGERFRKIKQELDEKQGELSDFQKKAAIKEEQLGSMKAIFEKSVKEAELRRQQEEEQKKQIAEAAEAVRKDQETLKLDRQDLKLRQEDLSRQKSELKREQELLAKRSNEQFKEKEEELQKKEETLQRSLQENQMLLEEVSRLRFANLQLEERSQELAEELNIQKEQQKNWESVEKARTELSTAKRRVGQYMKEVKTMQEGLYSIYPRMNFLAEAMSAGISQAAEQDFVAEKQENVEK